MRTVRRYQKQLSAPSRIGSRGSGFLLVSYGLAEFDRNAASNMTLARFSDLDNKPQRSNDGTADPHELFFGRAV